MVEMSAKNIRAVSISGPGKFGYLIPYRESLPPVLVFDWQGGAYGLYLGGQLPFRFFNINLQKILRGLLIEDIEILVDIKRD